MASDLISRDTLLADFRESVDWLHKIYCDLKYEDEKRICSAEIASFNEVIMRVKDATAVDAVEVVRCKDCKHCFQWKIPFCDAEIGLHPIPHNIEIWFCPFGERKENAVD